VTSRPSLPSVHPLRSAVPRRSILALGVAAIPALLPVLLATPASAQSWPEKPMRIIVPWAPGGSTDIVGRMLASDLSKRFSQNVVIENRAGAGSIVGLEFAAAAAPDGYTWMLTSTGYGFIIQKAKVDLVNSFAPVAMIGTSDSALVVHPAFPANNVKELIAIARKRPNEINFASSGIGGFPHLNTELFMLLSKTRMTHVPFKGGGPALADNVAGNSQLQIGSLPGALPFIKSGRLRLIAMGGPKRNPAFPDVPTINESGLPGYESQIWFGLFAPRATPPNIIGQMHGAINAVLETPDMVRRLDEQGVMISRRTTAEFAKLMEVETAKWAKVIKAANVTGE
jgi:tripartite-type tricarboxylate transporter receptor subunit TctC